MLAELEQKIFTPSLDEIDKERDWIFARVEEVGPELLGKMSLRAATIRNRAYAPYSGYKVGACLLSKSGALYLGCNHETVTFTGTKHAEGVAISSAIVGGEIELNGREFIHTLVVAHSGDSPPCGGCRQNIVEHANNCLIINANDRGEIIRIASLKALFPHSFNPSHLGK